MTDRQQWLNGWFMDGTYVWQGAMQCCAGCGKGLGLVCMVFSEDDVYPDKEPDWPFNIDSCPVCILRNRWPANAPSPENSLTIQERLIIYKESKINKEKL